jgi:hypothetical protein
VRIRQAHRTDRDLLARGFERLSPESRYRRFLTPMHELDQKTLRYLTDLDHRDHEAMFALDESGEGVGVARYVRSAVRPDTARLPSPWSTPGRDAASARSCCRRSACARATRASARSRR